MTRNDYDKATELIEQIEVISHMINDLDNPVNGTITLKSANNSIILEYEDAAHFSEYYNNKLAELEKELSLL